MCCGKEALSQTVAEFVSCCIRSISHMERDVAIAQIPGFVSLLSDLHDACLLSFPVRFALERWARHLSNSTHERVAEAIGLLPIPLKTDVSPRERRLPLTLLGGVFESNLSLCQDAISAMCGGG